MKKEVVGIRGGKGSDMAKGLLIKKTENNKGKQIQTEAEAKGDFLCD